MDIHKLNCKLIYDTKVGKKHVENEDAIIHRVLGEKGAKRHWLFGVVDGASGAAFGGSLARWMANRLMMDNIPCEEDACDGSCCERYLVQLREEFEREFADIDEMLQSYASFCIGVVSMNSIRLIWAGDTLAYYSECANDYATQQVTSPHGVDGKISKYFGGQGRFEFESIVLDFKPGDVSTIVSDGAVHNAEAFRDAYTQLGFVSEVALRVTGEGTAASNSDDVSLVACRRDR